MAYASAAPAVAQTLKLNAASGTAFTYGNQTFGFSSCTYNGSTCSSSDNAELEAISSGRGGTTIEVAPVTGSSIYSGTGSYPTLSFTLTVTPTAASRGISSITDTVNGTATGSNIPAGNSHIFSTVAGTNESPTWSALTASVGTPVNKSFTLTTHSTSPAFDTFTITIGVTATSGDTLTLNNVALLFQPAPEPASIALVTTGVVGLSAVRRRIKRKPAPTA